MDKEMFDLYVEGILAPTLRPGDVVIRDNLPAHRSNVAASILKEIGAWFLFLPKYSPDLNPIEMAFSKLKALIRKVAARTYERPLAGCRKHLQSLHTARMLQLLSRCWI